MAYRNTFFRWLFLYSLTFGLTYVLKLDNQEGEAGRIRAEHITTHLVGP